MGPDSLSTDSSWTLITEFKSIRPRHARRKSLSDGICVEYPNKSKYLTPLLYSKCLDTTTMQDRTGSSLEKKGEVIAVFNYLMAGYREGGARHFYRLNTKDRRQWTGVATRTIPNSRKVWIHHSSQKLKYVVQRHCGTPSSKTFKPWLHITLSNLV